jgi:hypothetical protein
MQRPGGGLFASCRIALMMRRHPVVIVLSRELIGAPGVFPESPVTIPLEYQVGGTITRGKLDGCGL